MYTVKHFYIFFSPELCSRSRKGRMASILSNRDLYLMTPSGFSSLKWENDGELSSQDIWSLVKKLTRIEEAHKASNLLHLSSKHLHAKKS